MTKERIEKVLKAGANVVFGIKNWWYLTEGYL
jgi:hypothetical protein